MNREQLRQDLAKTAGPYWVAAHDEATQVDGWVHLHGGAPVVVDERDAVAEIGAVWISPN